MNLPFLYMDCSNMSHWMHLRVLPEKGCSTEGTQGTQDPGESEKYPFFSRTSSPLCWLCRPGGSRVVPRLNVRGTPSQQR